MKPSVNELLGPPDLNEMGRSRMRSGRGIRTRWRVAAALAGVALVSGIGSAIARYNPFYPGGVYSAGAPGLEMLGDDLFRYQRGHEFFFAFSVNNEGRWGVTISDVMPRPDRGILRLVEARIMPRQTCCPWEDGRPFRPFALRSHETADIMIRAVMTNRCEGMSIDGGPSFPTHEIAYSFVGIPHHADLQLGDHGFTIGLKSFDDCPEAAPR